MNSTSANSAVTNTLKNWTFTVQDYSLLAVQSVRNIFATSRYLTDLVEQMDLIGVGSLRIVVRDASTANLGSIYLPLAQYSPDSSQAGQTKK